MIFRIFLFVRSPCSPFTPRIFLYKHQTDICWGGNIKEGRKECCHRKTDNKGFLLAVFVGEISGEANHTSKLNNGSHHVKGREADGIYILLLNSNKMGKEIVKRFLVNIILEIEIHG